MKKLVMIAALLMATTSAHAGGITFQINGERIHIEAPRHCDALSCIKITAPGFSGSLGDIDLKGFGSKKNNDNDVADTTPAKPAPAPAPAPVQATAPAPLRPLRPADHRRHRRARAVCLRRCDGICSGTCARRRRARASTSAGCRGTRSRADDANWHLGHRREQGQRSHRAMWHRAVRLCGEVGRKDPDQHDAGRLEMDRPDSRPRQRPQLQLDDRDEGQQRAARSGLRLRRHILRRPDLEARELTPPLVIPGRA